MAGGWGDPRVPAHEPYFYLFGNLTETPDIPAANLNPSPKPYL